MILGTNQTTGLGLRLDVEIDRVVNYESVISLLMNSAYFFLENVFIMRDEKEYNLIVIHKKKLFEFKTYKSAKGARIAFNALYRYKAYKKGVKAEWTPFYRPDRKWLEKKLNMAK